MDWNLDKSKPICPQITDRLCSEIALERIKANEKLPSVRELALEIGVNPNTVQKAFEQLEGKKLIYSKRGLGWFVADNIDNAKGLKEKMLNEKITQFFREMKKLGFDEAETKKLISEWSNGKNADKNGGD